MYAVQLAFADTAADESRLELRPAHRERLKAMADDGRLLLAGPWADDTGALLVFLVDSREELDAILAADPYYSTPGVTITSVNEWNPVTRHESLARV
jgi:uncharacterized protein YciI